MLQSKSSARQASGLQDITSPAGVDNRHRVESIAREIFGHAGLRPFQSAAIDHILSGRDVLLSQATGSGKSLCFQLPALLEPQKVTVVVSPSIALIRDQASQLERLGIHAAFLDSLQTKEELRSQIEAVRRGECRLLYVAPERFVSRAFREEMRGVPVWLIAVDEVHCVSLWGHHFRPSYLMIPEIRKEWGSPRLLGLTATAPRLLREDIRQSLKLGDVEEIHAGIVRENIDIAVEHFSSSQGKTARLFQLLAEQKSGAAIVYTAFTRVAEILQQQAAAQGISSAVYHAQMPREERTAALQQYLSGEVQVMFATNAFGMGVDKEDIELVVHYNVPDSPEAFMQEIGRAGRNGKPARAIVLFEESDQLVQSMFVIGSNPSPEIVSQVYRRLWHNLTEGGQYRMQDKHPFLEFALLESRWGTYTERLQAWSAFGLLQANRIVEMDGAMLRFLLKPGQGWEKLPLDEAAMERKLVHDLLRFKVMQKLLDSKGNYWRTLQEYSEQEELPIITTDILPAPQHSPIMERILETLLEADTPVTGFSGKVRASIAAAENMKIRTPSTSELQNQLKIGLRQGFIVEVTLGTQRFYSVGEQGVRWLESLGVEIAVPSSYQELRDRMFQPSGRQILKEAIRPLMQGRLDESKLNALGAELVDMKLEVLGTSLRGSDLASDFLHREGKVDYVIVRAFLKELFGDELRTVTRK